MKKKTHSIWKVLMVLSLLPFLSACGAGAGQSSANADFDPQKDYFPDKVSIDHSIGFDVAYHSHYKLLHLFRHYNDVIDTVSYVLLQRGTPTPEAHASLPVIQVPIEKAVSMSTTQLGMFDMLEAFDQLKGIEIRQYVSNPKVIELVESGAITEVAPAGSLNVETVINMGAEVVIGVGYPNSQNEAYQQLERTGIPVLLNADWQEKDLLGRAEWAKLIAVLLNKEALINEKFSAIEIEYNRVLAILDTDLKSIPTTITSIAKGDTWHVSGGRSFANHLLQLAKVNYPWNDDTSTGSLPLDFETVYEIGLEADFWMAPSNAKTLAEVLERDARYADFKSFKNGNVFNVYGRYTEGGGNDYYETGVVEPHVVLKDIVKIFHPELLPDHSLVYHTRLK